MAKTVISLVFIIYLVVFGVVSLAWPAKVRDFYRRQYSKGLGDSKRLQGVSRLTQYNPSAAALRVFGAISLFSALLLAYEWFKG